MNYTATIALTGKKYKTAVLDGAALLVILLTPALSHLLSVPLYLLEPMRIMLILSLVHTSRKNTYILAAVLPLFSFLISSHPAVIKSLLITGELFLNVWLFFFLQSKMKYIFNIAFVSILLSKAAYYTGKLVLLNFGLLQGDLISTPLMLQAAVTVILSGYIFFFKLRDDKTA